MIFTALPTYIVMRPTRDLLEKKLKINLDYIKKAFIDNEKDIHCENLIGETTLPLGVAGPVQINNSEFRIKNYYVPLATTEGALVASVNRGSKAITLSGGADTNVHKIGATRGPVFYTGGIKSGEKFYRWLKKNESQLKKEAEKTSAHLKLKKMEVRTLADYAYVRFYFDTEEAMGMNMATFATQKIAELIEKKTKIKCLSVAGNYDIDKKPAWLNFINGRGFKVWADVILTKKIIKDVLKTDAKKIFDVWLAKCMIGSTLSGSFGFNAHYANIVAAFFAATGQDLAHVVEGSLGVTIVKPLENGDLYFSVYLPSVMLGIVGGGMKLATKKEALSIIAAETSEELAQVLAGAVLAGEISLLSSLAQGSLAKAHKNLGR